MLSFLKGCFICNRSQAVENKKSDIDLSGMNTNGQQVAPPTALQCSENKQQNDTKNKVTKKKFGHPIPRAKYSQRINCKILEFNKGEKEKVVHNPISPRTQYHNKVMKNLMDELY